MNTDYRLYQMRQNEMEQTAQRERQVNELRRWQRRQDRRNTETPSDTSKRTSLLARISVLF